MQEYLEKMPNPFKIYQNCTYRFHYESVGLRTALLVARESPRAPRTQVDHRWFLVVASRLILFAERLCLTVICEAQI
jgi:hypothetical protein